MSSSSSSSSGLRTKRKSPDQSSSSMSQSSGESKRSTKRAAVDVGNVRDGKDAKQQEVGNEGKTQLSADDGDILKLTMENDRASLMRREQNSRAREFFQSKGPESKWRDVLPWECKSSS